MVDVEKQLAYLKFVNKFLRSMSRDLLSEQVSVSINLVWAVGCFLSKSVRDVYISRGLWSYKKYFSLISILLRFYFCY